MKGPDRLVICRSCGRVKQGGDWTDTYAETVHPFLTDYVDCPDCRQAYMSPGIHAHHHLSGADAEFLVESVYQGWV